MDRRGATMAGLVALIVLAPVAEARSTTFVTSSLQWSGEAALELGDPVFLLRPDQPGAKVHLVADHVRIETDVQRKFRVEPAGFSTAAEPPRVDAVDLDAYDAGFDALEGSGLFLQAQRGTVEAVAAAGSITRPALPCLQEPSYFTSQHRPACIDLGGTVHLQASASSWTVHGDFTVHLWQYQGADGTWSGTRPTTATHGVGEYEFRLLRLSATQGRLEFFGASGIDVYGRSLVLAAADDWALAGLEDQPVTGPSTVAVRAHEGAMATTLTPAGARAGPIAFSATAAWIGAGLLLLAAVPLLATLPRRRAQRHLLYASQNLLLGNHRAAFRHADRARRHRDYARQGTIVATSALIRGQDHAAAARYIAEVGQALAPATASFLLAYLRMRQGRDAEARRHLADSLGADPTLLAEVRQDPDLARLWAMDGGAAYQ